MIKKGVIISIMIIFLLTARIVAYQEEKVELPNLFVNPLGFFLQILGLDNMGEAGDGYGCGDGSCDGNKNLNNCPDDCKEEIKDSKDKKAYKKKCCICNYWIETTCESRSWFTCIPKNGCGWDWTGFLKGTCKSHSAPKKLCDEWFDKPEQKDCDEKSYVEVRRTIDNDIGFGDPTGGLTGCTTMESKYIIHSSSDYCQAPFLLVQICALKTPSCKEFNFDFQACAMFDDAISARIYAEQLKKDLGGDKCVSISANQCYDNFGASCSSRIMFNINPKGVCGIPADCDFGMSCIKSGQTAYCNDKASGQVSCKKCENLWVYSDDTLGVGVGHSKLMWSRADLIECADL